MSEPETSFRAPSPEELAPLFPKYQILSLIATGGMGAVYHAMQTSLEREVAIKILPVEFGEDQEFCESFGAEAKAMARLNHPNLIGVYDFGEVNDMLFTVMEYVPGQSLHDACNGRAIDPAEVIRLLTGICHGLDHAHEHGILHRDIKPANILLDFHLQPKIGDFGLARPLDALVGEGEAIFGTPGYTAPEVLEPPHTMDQRADIFSLGVLMHELLTGVLPGSDPRPPSAISHCDPRFDAVVRKATHPEPQQRYQKASEITDALQKIASSAGPRVLRTASAAAARRPAAPMYPAQPSESGGGKLMVILVLIAAIVAVIVFRDRLSPNTTSIPQPDPVVDHQPEPVMPDPVDPDPEPVEPGPDAVVSVPELVEPEPTPVVPETQPEDSETVTLPQPEFDVDGFFVHARSVMTDRCSPDIIKRDEALAKNLADFRSEAGRLIIRNLSQQYHQAAARELDEFVRECEADGNRMGQELVRQLKYKRWLVELHEKHKAMESKIDEQMMRALAEQEKTYLHGLGLRVKALHEDDPAAADLIQAEIDKVTASSPDYFAGLMLDTSRND